RRAARQAGSGANPGDTAIGSGGGPSGDTAARSGRAEALDSGPALKRRADGESAQVERGGSALHGQYTKYLNDLAQASAQESGQVKAQEVQGAVGRCRDGGAFHIGTSQEHIVLSQLGNFIVSYLAGSVGHVDKQVLVGARRYDVSRTTRIDHRRG